MTYEYNSPPSSPSHFTCPSTPVKHIPQHSDLCPSVSYPSLRCPGDDLCFACCPSMLCDELEALLNERSILVQSLAHLRARIYMLEDDSEEAAQLKQRREEHKHRRGEVEHDIVLLTETMMRLTKSRERSLRA